MTYLVIFSGLSLGWGFWVSVLVCAFGFLDFMRRQPVLVLVVLFRLQIECLGC